MKRRGQFVLMLVRLERHVVAFKLYVSGSLAPPRDAEAVSLNVASAATIASYADLHGLK
jgi:hypothetical protein